MKLTYRERDVPERAVGREYPMEDNTREFVATVLSSRRSRPASSSTTWRSTASRTKARCTSSTWT